MFFEQNRKTGHHKFNDLQDSKFIKNKLCDRTQQAPASANMYHRAETGWVEREVYRSAVDAKVSVEISDVLVGPGRVALLKEMITGALVEVKAGVAMVTVDQKKQHIAPGVVLRVDQGQTLSIDNRRGKRPFAARLIRISLPR